MTYKEFIQNIIDTRGQWNDDVKFSSRGCARHHIKPRCIGGLPKKLDWSHHSNIIWLYPSEHFIAHKLLALENKDNNSLVCAYKRMCYSKYFGKVVTEEDYEICENLFRESHSKYLKGIKHKHHIIKNKEEYSKQKSMQCSGKNNPMYGKGYKLSGGNNGHAIRIFYYKDIKFECMKHMLEYINGMGLHLTKSCIMTWVAGKATDKLYKMYGDIIKDIRWEYKNAY